MIAGQRGRVNFNAFFPGHFFLLKIDRHRVSFGEGQPAIGGDHQVMDPDDLGVDNKFGGEIAGVVVDRGIVGAVGRDSDPSAHIPGLDDEYGVGRADRCFIVEYDRIGDSFGDYFVGGERIPRVVGQGVGGTGTKQGVKEDGEWEQQYGPPAGKAAACGAWATWGGVRVVLGVRRGCRGVRRRCRGVRRGCWGVHRGMGSGGREGVALAEVVPVFEPGESRQGVEGMYGR